MPASPSSDDLVIATVAHAEPTPLPDALAGVVDCTHPDPARWVLRDGHTIADAGLYELWASAHSVRVLLGRVAEVRELEALLAASGAGVSLVSGWLDQAAAVATAQRAMSVVPVDGPLFMVAERLGRIGTAAMAYHRGVTFAASARPVVGS